MAAVANSGLRRFFIGSLSLLVFALGSSVAQELPKGWHTPPANLTRQDFRQRDPNRFLLAIGDFNGDGTKDKALLLVNEAGTKLGLFVCLRPRSFRSQFPHHGIHSRVRGFNDTSR
jgi:hypothetical protein